MCLIKPKIKTLKKEKKKLVNILYIFFFNVGTHTHLKYICHICFTSHISIPSIDWALSQTEVSTFQYSAGTPPFWGLIQPVHGIRLGLWAPGLVCLVLA